MIAESEIDRVAAEYRAEGYEVVVGPARDQLPAFAAGFGAEVLARRGTENVLVRVKRDRAELEADPDVSRQAEVTNAQPNWRYDLVILDRTDPGLELSREAEEPSPDQIADMLAEAESVSRAGSPRAGLLVAWAGLEAVMRRAAQRAGVGGRVGTPPRTLIRELYAVGRLSHDEFRQIDKTWSLRNAAVHGLGTSGLDAGLVQSVIAPARRLLADEQTTAAVAG